MADILDEVESEYHAEQLRLAASRYAWVGVAALVAILVGVGGWEYWQSRQAAANTAAATTYLDDSKTADALINGDAPARTAAAQKFAALAATAPTGYRTLARLRQAGLLADAGKLPDAQAIWDRVSTDPDADPVLRQLSSLLWVERSLDSADPNALRTRLVTLTSADNPFHTLAAEAQAVLDMRMGQTEAARTLLRRLAADPTAPQGVRGRDAALLSRLGG